MVAHLIGFDLPIVLDVEMLHPGEGEIVAAKRLVERLLQRYHRFFDAIVGDGLYWAEPFLSLCRKHDKHLLAVLKANNPALMADARALLQGEPDLVRRDQRRLIQYWDQEGFTTDAIKIPFRVLRTEEHENRRERIAGQWVQSQPVASWFWASSIPRSIIPARQLAQIGHARWRIENTIFNALGQNWGLNHCFHHDPVAILNFILILFMAYTLVACFHQRNLKPTVRERFTLIAVANQILLGIASFGPGIASPRADRGRVDPPP